MNSTAILSLCGVVLFPAGLGAAVADRAPLFAYETSASFELREKSTTRRGGLVQREISFVGDPRHDAPSTVTATLVMPENVAMHTAAGVLWVHWLGEAETTNRTEFLDEARALASRGVVTLLVDTMWAQPGWYKNRVLADDRASYVRQVIELRRALDLLAARPEVDAARIGLVGHDYGAMHGIIAAALDPRVKACVFIAAAPSFNDWAFYLQKPADLDAYLRDVAPLELVDYAPALAGRAVFLQFARKDFYVPIPRAEALFAAFAEPRRMEIYEDAGHEMTAPAAIRTDRTAWLVEHLQLAGMP